MIVDFSNVLSSTASVQVQAHWEPIADATYNLHQPTQEQFDRLKARLPETVNMEWEQVLKLFKPKPVHLLKKYSCRYVRDKTPRAFCISRGRSDSDTSVGVCPTSAHE